MSYFNIYKKRANRYGEDYQSRVQGQREKTFDLYLQKSIYLVEFDFDKERVEGSFEKYKQDETETLHYLLTRTSVKIPAGTVLMIPNKDGEEKPWMVYYLENIKASGYNKYVMLKMSHFITWRARDGQDCESWAYMYGQENNMLKDEIRSRSRMDTIYAENLKSSFFVLPLNDNLRKDDYIIIPQKGKRMQEQYRVTGYDIQSSDGVEYVTIDPIYEFDTSPIPTKEENDSNEDFFWFNGGVE